MIADGSRMTGQLGWAQMEALGILPRAASGLFSTAQQFNLLPLVSKASIQQPYMNIGEVCLPGGMQHMRS